jgi:hypothetical protein
VNEIKINENMEENQIFRTYDRVKKNKNFKKINNFMLRKDQKKAFPSLPHEKLGISIASDNNKKTTNDGTNTIKLSVKNINISRNKKKVENPYNNIYIKDNTFHPNRCYRENFSINFNPEKYLTIKNFMMNKSPLAGTTLKKSNSDFMGHETTTYRFPQKN